MPRSRTSRPLNPDRRNRHGEYVLKAPRSYQADCEWAWTVPTTPRERLVLLGIAARPGSTSQHLARRTTMHPNAISESVNELLEDGWIVPLADGGYAIEPAVEEKTELPSVSSALGSQLADLMRIAS